MKRCLLFAVACVIPSAPALHAQTGKTPMTFETHVRPILKANCFECHGEGKKLKGGLDLRLRHYLVKGGKSGPVLVPGKPGESPILQRVRSHEMPPGKKKLTKDEIAVI